MDRISALEKEIAVIRKTLNEKEKQLYELKKEWTKTQTSVEDRLACGEPQGKTNGGQGFERLPKWAIERYSRQILLPDIGVKGQAKLCNAKVLIVGAGGLGCPAAMYLAGAGVGEIGIVDYDTVELTNIHRQIAHGESDQGISKVESAASTLRNINSRITVTPHNVQLDSHTALELAARYHVLLDCSDNVPTRYLLNDVCVLAQLPLISGSALKMEGQITIYGYRANKNESEKDHYNHLMKLICQFSKQKALICGKRTDKKPQQSHLFDQSYIGPCYRCVFPTPPPPEAVGSCSANGVAGPVPGVIGALQALEAIKYIVGHSHEQLLVGRMLLFDGEDASFRNVRLRARGPQCASCSGGGSRPLDYEAFCRARAREKDLDLEILDPANRISAPELASKLSDQCHLLVDVRSEPEFSMCSIDGAVNSPIDNFRSDRVRAMAAKVKDGIDVTFVCRRGNDSQVAAQRVLDLLDGEHTSSVRDLVGGLHSWAKLVDKEFPVY